MRIKKVVCVVPNIVILRKHHHPFMNVIGETESNYVYNKVTLYIHLNCAVVKKYMQEDTEDK